MQRRRLTSLSEIRSFRPVILIFAVLLGVGLAFLLNVDWREVAQPALIAVISTTLIVTLGPGTSSLSILRRDWFHPLVAPVMYVLFALMAPLLYLSFSRRPIGEVTSHDASALTTLVIGFCGLGFVLGVRLVLMSMRNWQTGHPNAFGMRHVRLRWLGRMLLLVALIARILVISQQLGRAYGQGSVRSGGIMVLDNVASICFFSGFVLTVLGNVVLRSRVLGKSEAILSCLYLLSALYVGNRSEFIAPAILILFSQHEFVRRMRLGGLAASTLFVLLVGQIVLGTRSGILPELAPQPVIERVLVDYVSPVFITNEIVTVVPLVSPFRGGSTYFAGLKRQLPSPIANAMFGPTDDTGSFVFRSLIGFQSQDAGFGFSLPSEGYLNFGIPGGLGAGFAAGAITAYAYRRWNKNISRPINVLYPIILATLPLNLRTDLLGQVKSILYPMVLVWLAFRLSRVGNGIDNRTVRVDYAEPKR